MNVSFCLVTQFAYILTFLRDTSFQECGNLFPVSEFIFHPFTDISTALIFHACFLPYFTSSVLFNPKCARFLVFMVMKFHVAVFCVLTIVSDDDTASIFASLFCYLYKLSLGPTSGSPYFLHISRSTHILKDGHRIAFKDTDIFCLYSFMFLTSAAVLMEALVDVRATGLWFRKFCHAVKNTITIWSM
jgi:hypothetical protein